MDSVASKHKKSATEHGTQRIQLNDVVHLPLVDLGGIMGFKLLPLTLEELEKVDLTDPHIDVFEIT